MVLGVSVDQFSSEVCSRFGWIWIDDEKACPSISLAPKCAPRRLEACHQRYHVSVDQFSSEVCSGLRVHSREGLGVSVDQFSSEVCSRHPSKVALSPRFQTLLRAFERSRLRRAHSFSFDSLYFKESQGVRAPPYPPLTTSALAGLSRRTFPCRNKTDRLHGVKPIEGEDTCRGILASYRGSK